MSISIDIKHEPDKELPYHWIIRDAQTDKVLSEGYAPLMDMAVDVAETQKDILTFYDGCEET